METKEYVVSGRLFGKRACRIRANSAGEAMKLARKAPPEVWKIIELHVSADLTARRLMDKSTPLKDQLKTEIEAALPNVGE